MARVELPVDVDLDALKAARLEASPAKSFRFGGQVFTAPPKMPLYAAIAMGEGKVREALTLWLGEKQERLFSTLGSDDDDVAALVRGLYGVTLGESEVSGKP